MTRIRFRTVLAGGALALATLAGAGCATVGRPFPAAPVTQIQLHHTTQAQIREIFGAPWRTGIEDGRSTWTYGFYRYSLFAPAKTRDLVIRFDADGTVASYSYNATEPETSRPQKP